MAQRCPIQAKLEWGCLLFPSQTLTIPNLVSSRQETSTATYPDRVGVRTPNMNTSADVYTAGLFDDRYRAFLQTVVEIRPRLHRYCARMTGSVMDGEDVVQEALFEAYRKLEEYDDSRPLTRWLFGIAHNRCIDLLRRRGVRDEYEA